MGGKTFFGVLLVAVGLIAAYAFATGKLAAVWQAISGLAPANTGGTGTPTPASTGADTANSSFGSYTTAPTVPQASDFGSYTTPSTVPTPQAGTAPPAQASTASTPTIANSGITITPVSPSPYQVALNPLVTSTPATTAATTATSANGAST